LDFQIDLVISGRVNLPAGNHEIMKNQTRGIVRSGA